MGKPGASKPDSSQEILEYAALRNAPLSVSKPELIGKEPMPRGRFLVPEGGAIIIENLQVPGRSVDIAVGDTLEAFFQHDGHLFSFRTRVLEMDAPVQLNGTVMVRGMKIAAPRKIDSGNRRQIYRQSFASVNPLVGVQVWAVPREALSKEQAKLLGEHEEITGGFDNSLEEAGEYLIERSGSDTNQLASADLVQASVPGLVLAQLGKVQADPPHWYGEVADASEFGLGLTVHDVVYSRFKIFQPLAIRFRLPESKEPLDFLFEVRRVQRLKAGARLGGLLLINAANQGEVKASRELSAFALHIQRERARKKNAA